MPESTDRRWASGWRRTICLLLVMLTLIATGCRAPARSKQRPGERPSAREAALTPEQRRRNLESFDYVWKTVQEKHYDPTLGGLDWNAVRDELRPRVEQAQTMGEARRVIQRMIGRLEQSHFGIIPASVYREVDAAAPAPQDRDANAAAARASTPTTAPERAATQPSARKRGEGVIGAEMRILDGRAIVTRLDPQLGAAQAGVRPGWEIVEIDGRNVRPMIEQLEKGLPDNPMRGAMLTMGVEGQLRGEIGQTVQITFRDGRGRTVRKQIEYAHRSGTKATLGHLPAMYVTFESRRIEPNVGYIAFKPFMDPERVLAKFAEAMSQFRDADGIILDLRGNPGGIGGMAMGVGNFFALEPNRHLGTMQSRAGSLNFVLNPRPDAYSGPLAILVDDMSMSTSEILAGGLQDLGRARVFGTRTPGAALPSIVERLPNGDGFQYAIANYISAGGQMLEGRGVIPDQEVRLDRESLLKGQDPVIDAAVEWISSQKRP